MHSDNDAGLFLRFILLDFRTSNFDLLSQSSFVHRPVLALGNPPAPSSRFQHTLIQSLQPLSSRSHRNHSQKGNPLGLPSVALVTTSFLLLLVRHLLLLAWHLLLLCPMNSSSPFLHPDAGPTDPPPALRPRSAAYSKADLVEARIGGGARRRPSP